MLLDFNNISLDSLLTLVLVIVFIIQTGYLIRQTNFGVRSSQANLTETWRKEFVNIDIDLLMAKTPNTIPDESEFRKLVSIFDRMHPLFRAKLLKPSDFAYTFIVLDRVTNNDDFRKTKIYKENYLRLQHIFSDFNKDHDMVLHLLNIPPTSTYENILKNAPIVKSRDSLRKNMLDNWSRNLSYAKYGISFYYRLTNKKLFPLKPPI